MTTTAGMMLLNAIRPLILAAISRNAVRLTGTEDHEEVAQDCLAMAASMLDSAEANGKTVTPGNIAYFAIQSLKNGRRSQSNTTTDAMGNITQNQGRSTLVSLDAPVTNQTDEDDDCTLHDSLAYDREDPAEASGRHLDWQDGVDALSNQQASVLLDTAMGLEGIEIAERLHVSAPRVTQIKREIGKQLYDTWKADPIMAASAETGWRQGVRTWREQRLCRFERRVA